MAVSFSICQHSSGGYLSALMWRVAIITYVGRVIDSTNQNPIKGAQIALDFEGVPPTVYTDNNWIYRFTLAFENEKVDGRLRVDATGYEK